MITDLEVLKVSCHTKFIFAEREAQCSLGECGPQGGLLQFYKGSRGIYHKCVNLIHFFAPTF